MTLILLWVEFCWDGTKSQPKLHHSSCFVHKTLKTRHQAPHQRTQMKKLAHQTSQYIKPSHTCMFSFIFIHGGMWWLTLCVLFVFISCDDLERCVRGSSWLGGLFKEPVAVALSAVNLAIQFHGWVSFFILVYYKLPLRPDKKTYYEYTGLWHIYGILSMNAWLWSAVFHSR